MKEQKMYEVMVNADGIRFRHANPNPMSAEQKYHIILTLIACVTAISIVITFFSLFH